jgi:hypothetical protein
MKAIELTDTVDNYGNLALDEPISIGANSRVRVIILCAKESSVATEVEPDDTSLEEVKSETSFAGSEFRSKNSHRPNVGIDRSSLLK